MGDERRDVFVAQRVGGVEGEGFTAVEARVDAIEQQGVEVDIEPQGRVEELRDGELEAWFALARGR